MGAGIWWRVGTAAGAVVALVGCRGEPKVLEPRSPPPRAVPAVSLPPTPPPDGYGRVVLDSTEQSLRVTARSDMSFVPPGHSVPPNRTGELCATPCATDLPVGRYKLFLTSADGSYDRSDTDTLEVTPGTTYYLRSPGKFEPPDWIPVVPTLLIGLATVAVIGGAGLLAQEDDSQRVVGGALLGGGVVVGVVGGIMYYDVSRGSIQQGATTRWTDPPNAR